ncbi:hypothetical protein [Paraburkholderia nodosa]|uniref:hypothetical protein n=1 Tax=Paraburkholderia nodosa TaxID=392320 RepID=UPI000841B901
MQKLLRAQRVTLPRRGGVELNCVEACEVDAPTGVQSVVWRLLSNREVSDAHVLTELIDWYRARREIEMFFNVLKNACRVETLQLSQTSGARATVNPARRHCGLACSVMDAVVTIQILREGYKTSVNEMRLTCIANYASHESASRDHATHAA